MKLLLDSVILIDYFNNIPKAVNYINTLNLNNVVISLITRVEVLTGANHSNYKKIHAILTFFPTINLSIEDADLAAKLRNKFKWKLPDAFQAAIAKNNHCRLITRNTKDFSTKKHSFIIVPYKV